MSSVLLADGFGRRSGSRSLDGLLVRTYVVHCASQEFLGVLRLDLRERNRRAPVRVF